jgi:hypothetical protein
MKKEELRKGIDDLEAGIDRLEKRITELNLRLVWLENKIGRSVTDPPVIDPNKCSVCGMVFDGPTGYVCGNVRCPMTMRTYSQ